MTVIETILNNFETAVNDNDKNLIIFYRFKCQCLKFEDKDKIKYDSVLEQANKILQAK